MPYTSCQHCVHQTAIAFSKATNDYQAQCQNHALHTDPHSVEFDVQPIYGQNFAHVHRAKVGARNYVDCPFFKAHH